MGVAPAETDEAFRRLYPDQHYDRFLENGLRPDGRVLGLARETTIGLAPVSGADSSALAKVGETSVMTLVKLEITKPSEKTQEDGFLQVEVDVTPMSSKDARPGRQPEVSYVVAQQLQSALLSSGAVSLAELCIHKASAAWSLKCQVYVLSNDGSLLDACLLATVAALASLQLPAVTLSKDGHVVPESREAGDGSSVVESRVLPLGAVPLALTCGLRKSHLIADPTAEEEALMEGTVSTIMDQDGRIIGLHKPGGVPVLPSLFQDCIETTRLRYQALAGILAQALQV